MGYVFFVIFTILALLMIPFSAEAASAAAHGLKVFALDMLPTLFPFMVCAGFITKSRLFSKLSVLPRPLSGFVSALTCALLGTPSSAMIFGELYDRGIMGIKRASFLCGALNLTGPVFIVSVLAQRFFGTIELALPFAAAHYLPPFLISLPLCFNNSTGAISVHAETGSTLFISSISTAVTNSLRAGGTVVFFFVVHAMLFKLAGAAHIPDAVPDAISAAFEMVGGLKLFSRDLSRYSAAVCSVILSFGGLCFFIQAKLIFTSLRAKEYFLAKLLSSASAGFSVWLLYPLFIKDESVFSFTGESLESASSDPLPAALTVLGCMACAALTLTVAAVVSKAVDKKTGRPFELPRER